MEETGLEIEERAGRIILVTSCKGGVGKSTVTANLGLALAMAGRRTLLIDGDFGNRCLDLVLGCEDEMLYDIGDVCAGRVKMSRAAITDRRCPNLFAVAAPAVGIDGGFGTPDRTLFRLKVREALKDMELDYILIDTPGVLGESLELAAFASDAALIVATHQPTALRAAENTAAALSGFGIADCLMILNHFDESSVRNGNRPGVLSMIDRASLPLLGVIPEDPLFAVHSEQGKLAEEKPMQNRNIAVAFRNTAKRLDGLTVPLFSGWKKINRKVLVQK